MKYARAFASSFVLELRSLFRTGVFAAAIALCAAAVAFLPPFLRSDGTDAGQVSIYVRVVFGAVFMVSGAAAFGSACGSYAPARGSSRLSLDLLRPFPPALGYVARCLALAAFSAAVTLCGGAMAAARMMVDGDANPQGGLPECRRMTPPVFEKTLAEEAEEDYAKVLSAPAENEDEERRLANYRDNPKFMVIWALEKKAANGVTIVSPGATHGFRFKLPGGPCTVRIKCPLLLGLRSSFGGEFTLGGETAKVDRIPGSEILIGYENPAADPDGTAAFTFKNGAGRSVILRKRRDIVLLSPGDSFCANFARAAISWTGIVGLFCAFGLMFSSALSRPVAVFTAAMLLLAVMLAPVSSSQIPNPSTMSWGDFIGICISHVLAGAMEPVYDASPVGALADGFMVDLAQALKMLAAGCIAAPAALSPLAGSALKSNPQE